MASSTASQEINLLLLGETGAGKSTFINAFANYFKFNSLNDAISGEIGVLISSTFTITNEEYETKTITIAGDDYDDDKDDDDVEDNIGESSTKECGIYVFHAAENTIIRLIDTPGVGDTKGIECDKKNFENILKNISHHKYLNGICILLKPNNSRLNITFRYCIQELLSHLHKSAKDNIVFCFTNTRGTFFRPGDTLPVLKKQLDELEKTSDIEIKIRRDIIYCFDNDPFRFLAAKKEGMEFTYNEEESFEKSWEKSKNESVRLLQHIIKCDPHPIMETVSLNNARQTVLLLCEPLAEINRNIQENMVEVEKFKKEMKISDIADEKFKKKLTIPYIKLEVVNLERPRVVCTKNSCRTSVIQDNCHVKWKWLNTFIQKRSGAMKFGMCSSCGCHAKNHKAIFYNSVSTRIEKEVENIKERIDELKKYQNTVEDTVVKFTQFLKQNAITAFNDAYVEYLGYIIHLEKEKVSDASERNNNEILEGLEVTKRKYEEKVKTIKTIGKNESSSDSLSFEDIFKLEQKLYELPDIGEYLQAIKKEEEEAFKYQEKHYELPKNMLTLFKKIFKNL
ncbi:hypothetical protein C2G38_2255622 [Gigaspora rosea]|uniref:Uncharacterized protein n=1 Tax=Gigaspora rosea TaxID=44941 RepID=A0A397U010_9GLOM|nr:hypothetical protein C2G38_2255622 [Gigaspora rosea]